MPTKRTAYVKIENRTGQDILAVNVIHKYSDNYVNRLNWSDIPTGSMVNDAQGVEYNTGFMTTGRDWWQVSWITKDNTMYVTSPQNFRGLMDIMERTAIELSGPIAKIAEEISTSSPDAKIQAAATATIVLTKIADQVLNTATTEGFKQHILREEDSKEENRIVLHPGDKVEFLSKSGKSETVYVKLNSPR